MCITYNMFANAFECFYSISLSPRYGLWQRVNSCLSYFSYAPNTFDYARPFECSQSERTDFHMQYHYVYLQHPKTTMSPPYPLHTTHEREREREIHPICQLHILALLYSGELLADP